MVDEGVSTAKAFMVFDFRLDDRRLFDAMRVLGGARRDAPGPLRGPRPDRYGRGGGAVPWRYGPAVPRVHPLDRGGSGGDPPRHGIRARGGCARARRPPVVARGARARPRGEGPRGSRPRRDVPALPRADRRAIWRVGSRHRGRVRDLAAAAAAVGPGRALGRPGGRGARPHRHRPRPRPDGRREGRGAARHAVQRHLQRRTRHRDAADHRLLGGRGEGPADRRADGRPPGHHAGPALRPRTEGRHRAGAGRRPRPLRPGSAAARSGPPTSTTRATTRRTTASASPARSDRSSCVGGPSSATATSSGSAARAASSGGHKPAADPGSFRTRLPVVRERNPLRTGLFEPKVRMRTGRVRIRSVA